MPPSSKLFNTLESNVLTETADIYSGFYRKLATRTGFLSYRFGKEEKSQQRQRRGESPGRGGGFNF
jgi:hypothetical protein